MKVQVLSDVHLDNLTGSFPNLLTDVDFIVIAGDLSDSKDCIIEFFKKIRETNNVPIIWVFGNHEYYTHVFKNLVNEVRILLKDIKNLIILDNECYEDNGYVFIGSTFWTDFNKEKDTFVVQNALNDYNFIMVKELGSYRYINYLDILIEHKKSKKFIKNSLKKYKDKKKIVITHHAPSYQSVSTNYKNSVYNGGFVSDLDNFIFKYKPDVWIHGHVHSFFDYFIDKTRIVCNPKGYYFEHDYLENFYITI